MAKQSPKVRKMRATMSELARVASIMIDGEEAVRLATGRTPHHVACPDPLYDDLGGNLKRVSIHGRLDTCCATTVEEDFTYAHAVTDFGPTVTGVVEHHCIKSVARNLPR